MLPTSIDTALAAAHDLGAEHAAAAAVVPSGLFATTGDDGRRFRWASVTKLVTATAVLCAADDGTVDFDEPAGPPGATVRHLLAHASGLPFEGREPIAAPATTRIYSNAGFDLLGELLAERRRRPTADVIATSVLNPLGMADTQLEGRPSEGLVGPLRDLVALARQFLRPTLLAAATFEAATSVAFAGLRGILPGFGLHDPLDSGLQAARRQAAALDGQPQLSGDVRPLRGNGVVPVGRSGRRLRPGGPDRSALGAMGDRRLARPVGCGAR